MFMSATTITNGNGFAQFRYSAAGTHGSCPDRFKHKAYINEQEWDISSLAQCEQGIGCPVSNTFTDEMFMVPQGCSTIEMTAQKNGGRGIVTSIPPTRPSGYRGELEISDDGFGAADVYDVTVTLTCQNMGPTEGVTAGSTMSYNARISCAAQSQSTAQTTSYGFTNNVDSQSSCKMGRAEVYNPTARHPDGAGQGTWGTVCGHWFCKPPLHRWRSVAS